MLLSAAAIAKVPGPLVDVNWLDVGRGQIVLLYVCKGVKSVTKEGHIPGAA